MNTEELYISGFNHGYILQKHEPALMSTLLSSLTFFSEYVIGLKYGAEEYDRELAQKLGDIARLRDQGKNRNRGIDRE